MKKPTPRSIVNAFGGRKRLATLLDLTPGATWNWEVREKIPPGRWPELIDLAKTEGITSVTFDHLRAANDSRRKRRGLQE